MCLYVHPCTPQASQDGWGADKRSPEAQTQAPPPRQDTGFDDFWHTWVLDSDFPHAIC